MDFMIWRMRGKESLDTLKMRSVCEFCIPIVEQSKSHQRNQMPWQSTIHWLAQWHPIELISLRCSRQQPGPPRQLPNQVRHVDPIEANVVIDREPPEIYFNRLKYRDKYISHRLPLHQRLIACITHPERHLIVKSERPWSDDWYHSRLAGAAAAPCAPPWRGAATAGATTAPGAPPWRGAATAGATTAPCAPPW